MTPKEQLRQKLESVLADSLDNGCFRYLPTDNDIEASASHYRLLDELCAAVEEVYNKDLVLTVKLDEKQIEELRQEFMKPSNIEVWHSCGSCGAALTHTPSQQYEGT